jgi:hypothetical protein
VESKPAGFAIVALHRSFLLDQAQLVRKSDLAKDVEALAALQEHHRWFSWCLGLSRLLVNAADRAKASASLLGAATSVWSKYSNALRDHGIL